MTVIIMKTSWCLCILWSAFSIRPTINCSIYGSSIVSRAVGLGKKLKTKTNTGDLKKTLKLSSHGGVSSSKLVHQFQLAPTRQLFPVETKQPQLSDNKRSHSKITSDFAHLPDVSVTCSTTNFVVRVKKAFYGFNASAEELTLGLTCRSTGALIPYDDLLFTYPLTECDGSREVLPSSLIYKYVLRYKPAVIRLSSKAYPVNVYIECHFQRQHHVNQLAVQPTWKSPFISKKLKDLSNDFSIQLMDETWLMPATLKEYLLGQPVNVQVSASSLLLRGRLFINSCFATTSTTSAIAVSHPIIDNSGCLLESQKNPAATRFVSRSDQAIRFSLGAFQFTSDPESQVFIHCKLLVTSEEPSSSHKSCTYINNRWTALSGDDSICLCCDSQCVISTTRRAIMEGSVKSGPLLVSYQPTSNSHESLKNRLLPTTESLSKWEYKKDTVWFTRNEEGDERVSENVWKNYEVKGNNEKEVQRHNIVIEEEAGEEGSSELILARLGSSEIIKARQNSRASEWTVKENVLVKGSLDWEGKEPGRKRLVSEEEGSGLTVFVQLQEANEEEDNDNEEDDDEEELHWHSGMMEISKSVWRLIGTRYEGAEEQALETAEEDKDEESIGKGEFKVFLRAEREEMNEEKSGLVETSDEGGEEIWTSTWR